MVDCNAKSSDLKSTKDEVVEIVEIVETEEDFEFDADKYQH